MSYRASRVRYSAIWVRYLMTSGLRRSLAFNWFRRIAATVLSVTSAGMQSATALKASRNPGRFLSPYWVKWTFARSSTLWISSMSSDVAKCL